MPQAQRDQNYQTTPNQDHPIQKTNDILSNIDKRLEEATPKAARERLHRKLRRSGQKDNKFKSPYVALKNKHMKARIVPNKSANNDPRRNNPWVGFGLRERLEQILNKDNLDV